MNSPFNSRHSLSYTHLYNGDTNVSYWMNRMIGLSMTSSNLLINLRSMWTENVPNNLFFNINVKLFHSSDQLVQSMSTNTASIDYHLSAHHLDSSDPKHIFSSLSIHRESTIEHHSFIVIVRRETNLMFLSAVFVVSRILIVGVV